MKKTLSVFLYTIFCLYVLLPIGSMTYFFGYDFSLFNYEVFAIVTALFSLAATVLACINKKALAKAIQILFSFLPLVLCANWFFYIFADASITIVICMLICFICSIIISAKISKFMALKVSVISIAFIALLHLGFLTQFVMLFGQIAENTVVETIPSPNGEYYAEVIDNDQGALGGSTIINVCYDKKIDLLLFKIEKTPKELYVGGWRAYENMDIHWKDENCLTINSKEYIIE